MIRPTADYVLVEMKKEDLGGLTLPSDSKEENSQKGTVIKVGPGMLDTQSGMRTEMFVSEGDVVVWQKFAEADFTFEEQGKEYALVDIKQLMGVENE